MAALNKNGRPQWIVSTQSYLKSRQSIVDPSLPPTQHLQLLLEGVTDE
jgi:hypothetical protein